MQQQQGQLPLPGSWRSMNVTSPIDASAVEPHRMMNGHSNPTLSPPRAQRGINMFAQHPMANQMQQGSISDSSTTSQTESYFSMASHPGTEATNFEHEDDTLKID